MTRGRKGPVVTPDQVRDWLRRFEEEGESPPKIADKDGYDVRTVRRQINDERENRERREAKLSVLRQAMQQHYDDLCSVARRLESELAHEGDRLWSIKGSHMLSALREHLPRSPIWRNLDKWEEAQSKIRALEARIQESLKKLLEAGPSLGYDVIPEGMGSISDALLHALFNAPVLRGMEANMLNMTHFSLQKVDGSLTIVELQSMFIGRIPNEKATEFLGYVIDVLKKVTRSPDYENWKVMVAEREKFYRSIDQELVVIIFRRVVPGHCKFCPI